jgi:hypothetical protein
MLSSLQKCGVVFRLPWDEVYDLLHGNTEFATFNMADLVKSELFETSQGPLGISSYTQSSDYEDIKLLMI